MYSTFSQNHKRQRNAEKKIIQLSPLPRPLSASSFSSSSTTAPPARTTQTISIKKKNAAAQTP